MKTSGIPRPGRDDVHASCPASAPTDGPAGERVVHDLIGIGFGPSNLALAVAAEEIAPELSCLFLEHSQGVHWHGGMLIEGARMQISFLKDLVSLRNLSSPYTFLAYTKAKGRLEKFVNSGQSRVTRLEFQDYLSWVAEHFADRVQYGQEVVEVRPETDLDPEALELFRVRCRDVRTGAETDHFARNVVYATGGRPRDLPEGAAAAPAVVHSSRFLPDFPELFPDHAAAHEFAVVGDGQSAAEIVAYLLGRYPSARVHVLLPGYAFHATDNNPFANEQYFGPNAEEFYDQRPERRQAQLAELRNTNYAVVEAGFLDDLYDLVYADEVRGRPRLDVHRYCRVTAVRVARGRSRLTVRERLGGPSRHLECDGAVFASGYRRDLDGTVLGQVLTHLERDADGTPRVSPDYRAVTHRPLRAGVYLQGFGESSFGMGDTLLSLLAFRSEKIVRDVARRAPAAPSAFVSGIGTGRAYPPRPYLEPDRERLYAVIERFNFATLICSAPDGEVFVTHVPLVLDRAIGEHGVLLGHLDRANPQACHVGSRPLTVVFHGPNGYLSPDMLRSDRLPTWNSMSVHVRGRARTFTGRAELVSVFAKLCERADPSMGGYRLPADDARIDRLLPHVVGFEIHIEELVGRFKLSQELDEADRRRAALDLAMKAEVGSRGLIEEIFHLVPAADDVPSVRNDHALIHANGQLHGHVNGQSDGPSDGHVNDHLNGHMSVHVDGGARRANGNGDGHVEVQS